MNKALTKNKDDNFKCTHADLRLQVEERLQHLLQVHLNYCARHSATCQHLTFTIKRTTQATTTTTTTVLQPSVRDYPDELLPEETLTHPQS